MLKRIVIVISSMLLGIFGGAAVGWLIGRTIYFVANAQTLILARATSAQMEHPSWVMQLRFAPDGQEVIAIDLEGNLRIWEAKTGRLLREWKARDGQSLLCFDVSPDGKFLSVGDSSGR